MNNTYKLVTLKNNLKVLIYPKNDVHSISLSCVIKGGSIDDPLGKSGLAHMVEHFLIQGTNKLDTAGFVQYQETLGGAFNASTDDEITRVEGIFHYSKLQEALNLLKEIVFERDFKMTNLYPTKQIINEEISLDDDNPTTLIPKFARQKRFAKLNSLSFPSYGTKESIKRIQFEDIIDFYKMYYNPENCFLVVVGNVKPQEVRRLITKIFGEIKNCKLKPRKRQEISYSGQLKLEIKQPYSNIHSLITFPAFSRRDSDSDRLAANFINYILVSAETSRIYKILRNQKNLVYDISGETVFESNYGIFSIGWSSSPENYQKILKIIFDEIKKIKKQPVSCAEIIRVRNYCDQTEEIDFDNVSEIADWFVGELVFEDKILMPEDIQKMRNEITAAKIQEIAKQIFDLKKINVVAIGPVKNLKSQIGIGK